jgi:DNA-directed RNA polymerase II subunit RPB1
VYSIKFGVYTEAEKHRLAVVEVTSSTINFQSGMPRDDGPNSMLLGVDSHRTFCKTCNNTVDHCQGHAGIVVFPDCHPVYNPLHLINNDLIKLLRVVCFWCSTPLSTPVARPASTSKRAMAQVTDAPLTRTCPACAFGPTTEAYCPECALDRKLEPRIRRAGKQLRQALKQMDKLALTQQRQRQRQQQQQQQQLQQQQRGKGGTTKKRRIAGGDVADNAGTVAAAAAAAADTPSLRRQQQQQRRRRFERAWAHGAAVRCETWLRLVKGRTRFEQGRAVRRTTRVTCPNAECRSMCHPGFKRSGSELVPQWDECEFPSAEVEAAARQPFTAYKCWRVLRGIPESWRRDVLHLPAPIPDTFVWKSILVPPIFIRPSISVRGSKAEEDITRSIAEVVKHSQDIKKSLKALAGLTTEEEVADADTHIRKAHVALQKAVNMLVDRDIVVANRAQPMKQSVGHMKPRRTLMGRFTGKTGRLRGGLMSKRVGFCGRGVAGPHPTCDIDEVGIPERLARKIPVLEPIHALNRDALLQCVRTGAGAVGGALYVEHVDGSVTNLVNVRAQDTELIVAKCAMGDRVARMLRPGDMVAINRQPTLHILGFLGARVFLHPHSTIKDRTETEGPFNGDYDGDEKNFHAPQGEAARAELTHIMSIRNNTLDPANSAPAFVPVQGTMCGAHLMSVEGRRVPRELACSMYMTCRYAHKSPADAFDFDGDLASTVPTTRVLDVLFPPDFTFLVGGARVRGGRIQPGSAALTKKHLSGTGGLLHLLALQYGEPSIVEFLSDLGRIVRLFMRDYWGFSVSYADILLEPEVTARLQEDVADIVREANEYTAERDQLRVLSQASEATAAALASSAVYARSNLRVMIDSGSKGKPVNFEQIVGCIGQQIVGVRRPECDESGRALSCFRPGDTDVACFGWVGNSYTTGMTPAQNSFHARGAREGVTEVACGTAKSGYMQRRFQKLLENIKLVFDVHGLSVRNGRNAVVMLFFMDGFYTKYVEPCQLDCLRDALPAFQNAAQPQPQPQTQPQTRTLAARFPRLRAHYARLQTLRIELLESRTACTAEGVPDLRFMLPLNVDRWLMGLGVAQPTEKPTEKPTQPAAAAALLDVLEYVDGLPAQFHIRAALQYHVGRTLLEMWLRDPETLSAPVLRRLRRDLEKRVAKAAAEAGTAVGPLAASAAAKNITQATLNTFHSAGAGASDTKTGINRAKELVEVSATGVAQVRVRARVAAINRNKAALEQAARSLRPVLLQDVARDTRIFAPGHTALHALHARRRSPLLFRAALPQNAWSVVFDLDRAKLTAAGLTAAAAARTLSAAVSVPFRFSPWWWWRHADADADNRPQTGPTLTVWFSAAVFTESEVHTQSILLLDTLLAGYRQVQFAGVFVASAEPAADAPDAAPRPHTAARSYEIRATVKPLKKTDQASGLLPFFQNADFFDVERMHCSSLPIVHAVYGIEAALRTLFTELYATVSNTGFVHAHHIWVLCVVICVTGKPLAVTRHGMKAKGCDVLQQASFEQPRAVFTTASLHGDASVNVKHCLSSSSIVGGVAGVGTGTVDARTEPAYRLLWDAAKATAAEAAEQAAQLRQADGTAAGAATWDAHQRLKQAVLAMPVALRPTQFWDMEQKVPRLIREFRDFAVDWVTTHPQFMTHATARHAQQDRREDARQYQFQQACRQRDREAAGTAEPQPSSESSESSESSASSADAGPDSREPEPRTKRLRHRKSHQKGHPKGHGHDAADTVHSRAKRTRRTRRTRRTKIQDAAAAGGSPVPLFGGGPGVVCDELGFMQDEITISGFDSV